MRKLKTSAKLIDATRSSTSILYTMELVYPKIVHAELMTHRVFTRNSASSRAVPFMRTLEALEEDIFMPVKWMKRHSGMQGNEYFIDAERIKEIEEIWTDMAQYNMSQCKKLHDLGVSKQYVNRPLEWCNYTKVLVTTTEEGLNMFLDLRLKPSVEIHMRELAEKIRDATAATPELVEMLSKKKIVHAPYTEDCDRSSMNQLYNRNKAVIDSMMEGVLELNYIQFTKMLVSAARCARISYTVFKDGDDKIIKSLDQDIALAVRLFKDRHSSPFEHQAKVIPANEGTPLKGRNFTALSGFHQFRDIVERPEMRNRINALRRYLTYVKVNEDKVSNDDVALLFMDEQDCWHYSTSNDNFKNLHKAAYNPSHSTIKILLSKVRKHELSTRSSDQELLDFLNI